MRAWSGLALAAALAAATACGNPHKDTLAQNADFDCRDRVASYVVMGSLAAAEVGVQVDCAEQGPRVRRWTVERDGTRDEYEGSLGVHEFDVLWSKIDGAGWRYLKDCDGTGQPSDPVYTFDVKDWNGSATFSCTNAGPLPYPYNTLVDELDFKAAAAAPEDKTPPTREELN
ncbi:MAG TPA: hypothetical protein VM734_19555 [Kofleriaceae bacterium]|jgi:hypothetical protein|nr:hypothetical protein [Kofleriaceae bacterium]